MTTLQLFDINDLELEDEICRTLRERGLKTHVLVVARNGYINLLGRVENRAVKKEIGALVEGLPGVLIVTNHIRVDPWEEKRSHLHF